MSSKYYQVIISAENKEQVNKILNSLLQKKLVTGGQIINAPARFLWKREITDMDYYNIQSFTVERHKEAIIQDVRQNSIEEVPMISFVQIEGNKELFKWVDETLE